MRKLTGFATSAVVLAFGCALVAPAAGAADTGAPVSSQCVPAASGFEQARLAEVTDPAGIDSFDAARDRIAQLRELLVHSGDYRGTFVLAFDEILELTGPTLNAGIYDDEQWASDLAVEVVRLYVANLHEYVTGGTPAPHWADAFALTEQCDRSPGRVLTAAIVAHLVTDFPEALVTIGSGPEHTRDFYTFGNALVAAAPRIAEEFKAVYGTDLGPFFTGWFVGDLLGAERTTTLMFQSARTVAWVNNFGLQNPTTRDATRAEMRIATAVAGEVLDLLEEARTI
ncbi:DUF5995 family protein [Rhodococcus sp. HM1]|uniref:DUF5995 family protein n=1 Tax=Rhodococcus sp. HM1 TaxID=2937759 RepID=UPI00200A35FB|nr:DUF5995 family protein [Rhodococcus sp. HM1]MCK8673189.1 DUF5995 family protein [Rhodococcus sp. HM1]